MLHIHIYPAKSICCWSVNSSDFYAGKIARSLQGKCSFPLKNRTNWLTNKTCFALITHLPSIQATTSWKMLKYYEFKAQTSTGIRTGISCCHVLASRTLNLPCSFGQSARSIESRYVVMALTFTVKLVRHTRWRLIIKHWVHHSCGQPNVYKKHMH